MEYLHLAIVAGCLILLAVAIYTIVERMRNKNHEDKFAYYPMVGDLLKAVENGDYIDLSKEDFEKAQREGRVIAKLEEVKDDDEEKEEGEEKKEGFGFVKYGRYRNSRYDGGRYGKHWYPYYRYSGFPYWRFVRYPYSSYLKYPYHNYGSPYQMVRYDNDYFWVTL